MKHIKIAAGMAGTFDYGDVRGNMKEALDAGCDYCHSDAADMYDLQNLQLMGGHQIIKAVRSITDKEIECHLYAKDCDKIFIEKIAAAGATMLILPAEHFIGAPLAYIINWCHEFGLKIGLTIGCYTPLCFLDESIYDIDRLHIVIHGAGKPPKGETTWAWRRSALELVKNARKKIDACNPNCELAVDGGIRVGNLDPIVACNPDVLIFSTALYTDPDGIQAAVKKCRAAIDEAAEKYLDKIYGSTQIQTHKEAKR